MRIVCINSSCVWFFMCPICGVGAVILTFSSYCTLRPSSLQIVAVSRYWWRALAHPSQSLVYFAILLHFCRSLRSKVPYLVIDWTTILWKTLSWISQRQLQALKYTSIVSLRLTLSSPWGGFGTLSPLVNWDPLHGLILSTLLLAQIS